MLQNDWKSDGCPCKRRNGQLMPGSLLLMENQYLVFLYCVAQDLPDNAEMSRQLDRLLALWSRRCSGCCRCGLPDCPLLISDPLPHSASMALEALRLKCSRKWSICFSMELDGELSILIAHNFVFNTQLIYV